jgi:hypothetical protein
MLCRTLLALLLALVLLPHLAANFAPKFYRYQNPERIAEMHLVPLYLRLDGLGQYPGYAFFVRYSFKDESNQPDHVQDVLLGKPFKLEQRDVELRTVVLLAIPREMLPPNGGLPAAELLSAETPEILEHSLPVQWTVGHMPNPKGFVYLWPFGVGIREGKLEVDHNLFRLEYIPDPEPVAVPTDSPLATTTPEPATGGYIRVPPWLLGLHLSATAVLMGLWLVRRRRFASKSQAT